MSKSTIAIAVCVVIVIACAAYSYWLIYADEDIQSAQQTTEAAKENVQTVVKEYRTTVIEHDVQIKEAGRNAVEAVDMYSDDVILDAFNKLATSASRRNAERRCTVSSDK